MNAKAGNDNKENDRTRGKQGCGDMHSGERLIDFCSMDDLLLVEPHSHIRTSTS